MRKAFMAAAILGLLSITACGSDSNGPTAPGIEPEIVNSPDAFQSHVSEVDDYTGLLSYQWENSGELANVDQSSNIEPGQAILTLVDSSGTWSTCATSPRMGRPRPMPASPGAGAYA